MDDLRTGEPSPRTAWHDVNMAARETVSEVRRARVLRALGMTPWVRRASPIVPPGASAAGPAGSSTVACVVVLPQGCSPRELDLLGRALNACGATLARAGRVSVIDGQLAAGVPEARTYLVFGEAQAHALGRSLPAAAMHRAQIVLVDEPARVLTTAAAKKRLWNALRSVRRALAAADC
jgi:hypothetical protein